MASVNRGKHLRNLPLDEYLQKARALIVASIKINDVGCWIWEKRHQRNGYGQMARNVTYVENINGSA